MREINRRQQRGVITIFIAMVMLLLITLLVATAFSLSTTNLRAVSNVQARDESISAAQVVIEQVLTEDFGDPIAKARVDFPVDINGDAVDDYLVNVAEPVCVRATNAASLSASSVSLPGFSSGGLYNTVWEINAVATEATTGARVSIIQAVRVLLSQVEKDAVCP